MFKDMLNFPLVSDMDYFETKLMDMYGWSKQYTKEVIQEYRKFLFLAVKFNVAPSWEIDQVWHLHLLYTKEYWNIWCDEVLEKKIHHNPNPKGYSKGVDEYFETKKLYKDVFGYNPPIHVWTNWTLDRFIYTKKSFFNLLKQAILCLVTQPLF
jgi:hypothetical protein